MGNVVGHPNSGEVILGSTVVALSSDQGAAFTLACVRHIEGLTTAELLKKSYRLDESAWRALASNEELQHAIQILKASRVRSGQAMREMAAHLCVEAPGVLSTILKDGNMAARSRIEAARELRQSASGSNTDTPGASDRVSIIINLGSDTEKIVIDQLKLPSSPWPDKEVENDHDRSV
jgi:hypothetical protein